VKFDSRYLSPFQVVSRLLPKVIPTEMCPLTWICFSETINLRVFELRLIICNKDRPEDVIYVTFFTMAQQPRVDQGLLIIKDS
jgi:hypothetical protein